MTAHGRLRGPIAHASRFNTTDACTADTDTMRSKVVYVLAVTDFFSCGFRLLVLSLLLVVFLSCCFVLNSGIQT